MTLGDERELIDMPFALLGAVAAAAVLVTTTAACSSGSDDEDADRSSTTASSRPERSTTTASTAPAPTPAPSTTTTAPPPAAGSWWRPVKGLSWQWQLDGEPIDVSVDAEVFDVDLFETPAATVRTLHERGRKVICYLSAGSWEPYRPDAGSFPAALKGGVVEGWEDERWLDIRQLDALRPLMAARFDLCREKGFDAVEPDWLDHHTQDTGFPITAADQLRYNRMLADLAHERGLAIGLKNDPDQVAELADLYDFAVVEQCAEFGECELWRPFLDRNKAVFVAEYDVPVSGFCAEAKRLGLSAIRKRLDLDAWREVC